MNKKNNFSWDNYYAFVVRLFVVIFPILSIAFIANDKIFESFIISCACFCFSIKFIKNAKKKIGKFFFVIPCILNCLASLFSLGFLIFN